MSRPGGPTWAARLFALLALCATCSSVSQCARIGLGSRLAAAPEAAETGLVVLAAVQRPPLLRRQAVPIRAAPPAPRPRWTLLWADEFNSTELDGSKWEALEGDGSIYGIPGW